MKIAIISDIHANLEAFESVLAEIDSIAPDEIYCLGDIVGYNANPNECVELIRKRNIPSIMGNHDRVACGLEEPLFFNTSAKKAILWTRGKLNEDNRKFLRELPQNLSLKGIVLLVHGSPRDPDEYIYSETTASNCLNYMENNNPAVKVCFFGHTHYRNIFFSEKYEAQKESIRMFKLNPYGKYLVNPGSVGQPRDGDSAASFITYDEATFAVTYHPVKYDIEKTAGKVRQEDLPESLAERLFHGR
ncbi:MAG: metallophosphoesterase family protein [Candidatus Schekmanbacteria bacterium]|nr:metallophosphoesterase family protein [Candidatus Schekmanbacteria bacterium]